MADKPRPSDGLDDVRRARYELAVEDTFNGDALNESLWFPYHLPQWSSRTAAAARYDVAEGLLKLRIDADQPPWCPEYDGNTRVSSLQTVYSQPPLTARSDSTAFAPTSWCGRHNAT